MIDFKLNGQTISLPTSWEDVTFAQYLKMIAGPMDIVQMLAMLTGIEEEKLKKATIIGLESIVTALKFAKKVPEIPGVTGKIGKYTLPLNAKGQFNIQFESLGQFEDMRLAMMSAKDAAGITEAYATYVAIYLQKVRDGEYDLSKAQAMIPEVMQMPALEVLAAGSFFLIKLATLLTGIPATSPSSSPSKKKSKPVSKGSKKRSGRSQRSRK